MEQWSQPLKPAEAAESRLVDAILGGKFPVNSSLPAERELADLLGVTRPTLREAMQRLSRDGWIEIRHGKSTRVRNYLQEGNLHILSAIAEHKETIPEDFVPNLLKVRVLLAPEYTRLAIQSSPAEVLRILEPLQEIREDALAFAEADLNLHYQLTLLSRNPVFTLILNGFADLYRSVSPIYFSIPQARNHSRSFYKKLYAAVLSNDAFLAEEVSRQVMKDSIDIWRIAQQPD